MTRKIAVIGLGTMGTEVARYLSQHGAEVLGVDMDSNRTRIVASDVSRVATVDATDREAMRRLGVGEMDAACVAIRASIEASVMTTLVLTRHLMVPEVFARAIGDNHADILTAVGATSVVQIEREMGRRVASAMLWPQFRDYFGVSGDLAVVEYPARPEMIGRTLRELDFKNRFGGLCISIRRGGATGGEWIGGEKTEVIGADRVVNLPGAETTIEADDVLVLLGFKKELQELI